MLHPHTRLQYINDDIGYGIFATEMIPAGTISYVKDELEICLAPDHAIHAIPAYADIINKYAYREPGGELVIGWDLSKYVNHSCNANTLSTGYGFEIAVRDIQPGDQLTDDYGLLNIDYAMACSCGHSACRRQVLPNDAEHHWIAWDQNVTSALASLLSVPQPLMELLDTNTHHALMLYLNTGKNYPSVKNLLFQASFDQADTHHK